MSTLSRKQREIREREGLILRTARRLLLEEGYASVSMDRIAELVEYSKGTIYQHFKSKEDVLGALGVLASEARAELFDRAASLEGRARERLVAVGEAARIFVKLHPEHFQTEQIMDAAELNGKIPGERQHRMMECHARCMGTVLALLDAAIEAGDLPADHPVKPQEMGFALWGLSLGAHQILASGLPLADIGIQDGELALEKAYHTLLDGYGFLPLSTQWDYQATCERVRKEIFHDELRRLGEA